MGWMLNNWRPQLRQRKRCLLLWIRPFLTVCFEVQVGQLGITLNQSLPCHPSKSIITL